MTDRETLFEYRMKEAEETLLDAERMMRGKVFRLRKNISWV